MASQSERYQVHYPTVDCELHLTNHTRLRKLMKIAQYEPVMQLRNLVNKVMLLDIGRRSSTLFGRAFGAKNR